MLKKCTSCGEEKEDNLNNFTKKNNGETASMCKECKSKYDKEYRAKNREKKKEYYKKYSKENREKIKEYSKKWREENKEYRAQYLLEHKEKRSEQFKIWRESNKEHCIKKKKEWDKGNKAHIKEYREQTRERDRETFRKYYHTEKGNIASRTRTNKRRALKKELANNFNIFEWEKCVEFFEDRCAYCGRKAKLEQEHFVPLSKNGEFTKHNILPSCRTCNASKSDKDFIEWYKTYEKYNECRLKNIVKYFKEVAK